jgi:ERCC4-type nuclease
MPKKQAEQKSDPFRGLPPQIVKNLKRSGINSLAEAQKLSDEELAGVKNIGADMARKIREWKS